MKSIPFILNTFWRNLLSDSNYVQNYLDFFHPKNETSLQTTMQDFSYLESSFQSIFEMNKTIDQLYQELIKDYS